MEYVILSEGSIELLEDKVREYIEMGYTPLGGVAFNSSRFAHMQAMIKN